MVTERTYSILTKIPGRGARERARARGSTQQHVASPSGGKVETVCARA